MPSNPFKQRHDLRVVDDVKVVERVIRGATTGASSTALCEPATQCSDAPMTPLYWVLRDGLVPRQPVIAGAAQADTLAELMMPGGAQAKNAALVLWSESDARGPSFLAEHVAAARAAGAQDFRRIVCDLFEWREARRLELDNPQLVEELADAVPEALRDGDLYCVQQLASMNLPGFSEHCAALYAAGEIGADFMRRLLSRVRRVDLFDLLVRVWQDDPGAAARAQAGDLRFGPTIAGPLAHYADGDDALGVSTHKAVAAGFENRELRQSDALELLEVFTRRGGSDLLPLLEHLLSADIDAERKRLCETAIGRILREPRRIIGNDIATCDPNILTELIDNDDPDLSRQLLSASRVRTDRLRWLTAALWIGGSATEDEVLAAAEHPLETLYLDWLLHGETPGGELATLRGLGLLGSSEAFDTAGMCLKDAKEIAATLLHRFVESGSAIEVPFDCGAIEEPGWELETLRAFIVLAQGALAPRAFVTRPSPCRDARQRRTCAWVENDALYEVEVYPGPDHADPSALAKLANRVLATTSEPRRIVLFADQPEGDYLAVFAEPSGLALVAGRLGLHCVELD